MSKFFSCCCWMIGGAILLSACKHGSNQATQPQDAHKDSAAAKPADTISAAISKFSQAIISNPNNSDAYWRRGILEAAQKNYGPATADYQRAIKIDSTKALYYYSLADLDFITGHTHESKDEFEKCIKLDPKNTDALLRLGELYFLVKKYPEAIDLVNKALMVDKYKARAYFLKGMIYLEKHDTVKAVSSMQTAVEQDTKYYDAYIQLGLIFANKGSTLAVDYFNDAINMKPQEIEPYYDKGMFYQSVGDYDNATKCYNEILQMAPNNRLALYNMGFIYFVRDKDYKQSITYFDKAVRADTTYFMSYYSRGNCYEKLGQLDKALLDYSHAVYLKPNFSPASEAYRKVKAELHNP